MKCLITVFVIIILYISVCASQKGEKESHYKEKENIQATAVIDLIKRLVPSKVNDFLINVNFSLGPENKDTFIIETKYNKILISGNRGYAAASGFHYYLKYFTGCHISWSGNQLNMPESIPLPKRKIEITSNDKYKYYQNVCTASYSTVWWNWTRWEQEIDWMALNGINLPLAFNAQEAIWKRVFKSLGFTDHDLNEFFTGPAFLAWNRMGNLQLWAGPLSDNWHAQQIKLQHQILRRMREFGMTPVLPAFSGRVPAGFHRIFPNASISFMKKMWGHFTAPYTFTAFLEPVDPLFRLIGEKFLRSYIEEFSTDHIYNADLFNEMPPPSRDPEYLKTCAEKVFKTITGVDSDGIWIIQGWMFQFDQDTWKEEQSKAFLTAVPKGRMIVLDLQSELYPQFYRLNSYFGQNFIWCMLHNYGGVLGMYGSLDQVNEGSFQARNFPNSTMIGTGLTPEGIETNDIVYELANELSWRKRPVNLRKWISNFAFRRYGYKNTQVKKAWMYLKRSVYNASVPNHGKYILTSRPSLRMKPYIWYNPEDVFQAWQLYVQVSQSAKLQRSKLFRHDLIDVTRQALQLLMDRFYPLLLEEYFSKNMDSLRNISSSILEIYEDLEEALSSDEHFLLGRWFESAVRLATTPLERRQYGYNALVQITLWGPNGELVDYANKQWAGMISGYYGKRWKVFLDVLKNCVEKSVPYKQQRFQDIVFNEVESPFTLVIDPVFPVYPKGDSIEISQQLFRKYYSIINYSLAALNHGNGIRARTESHAAK